MAERQFGPYRLVRQIAVGGMAEIHLAKTKGIAGFEKYVALKMIHPNFAEDEQFIEMLVDEAKIAVQLSHGNIAQTFDLGRVGETYYITMEYVDGADLYKVLRRSSEMDMDVPLDICAFVGKEVASALDYAHRKRDHLGKSLGIVHRDVSPQNVLLSHAGEVKLVDFGIAKATMKARQTAVGVIKGKYYYMSPEQAWGDPIDHRSDIFSAGIVLYEMITGQMLYLEEDLQKLLEMARKANIAPPSRMRKGVPPQLERIIMHALAKQPGERYQSAADLASDLERFLHAYSPVFTASKVATLLRQVLGEPVITPDDAVEHRDGAQSTMSLDAELVAHEQGEIRDENSVLFRLDGLAGKPATAPAAANPPPAARPASRAASPSAPQRPVAPAAPRAASPTEPPLRMQTKIPSLPRVPRPTTAPPPLGAVTIVPATTPGPSEPVAPARGSPGPRVRPATVPPIPLGPNRAAPAPKPRQADENTREISQVAPKAQWRPGSDSDSIDEDLENIGERTVITSNPGMPSVGSSFMSDADSDSDDDLDNIGERTVVTLAPTSDTDVMSATDEETVHGELEPGTHHDAGFEEVPTAPRDFSAPQRRTPGPRPAPAPPALAANIHAPAVSELRKPRASRRTPPGGNVLQAIVGRTASEPMPSPGRARPATQPPPPPPPARGEVPSAGSNSMTLAISSAGDVLGPELAPTVTAPLDPNAAALDPRGMPPPGPLSQSMPAYGYGGQPPPGYPQPPAPYTPAYQPNQVGGAAMQTPPPGHQPHLQPGVPPHLQPYAMQPPPVAYQQPPPGYGPHGYPQMSADHRGFHPFGQTPRPLPTLSGQMRALEFDEIPSQYKLRSGQRWLGLGLAGVVAITAAASATYFIIRTTRDAPQITATVSVRSVPPGATVFLDGKQLADRTPLNMPAEPGAHHEIRLELPKHRPHTDSIDVPVDGHATSVVAQLDPITGQIDITSSPLGAEIWINGDRRVGQTPKKLPDLDMDSAKTIELRLKEYQPVRQTLTWPADGKIELNIKLQR